MESNGKHPTRSRILARLKRAEGHLRAVIGMIEADRSCLDLAQQLHAVEAALSGAKRELIHDHIENCLEAPAAHADPGEALEELKALAKYL